MYISKKNENPAGTMRKRPMDDGRENEITEGKMRLRQGK
jgi:hypothetical protein